MFDFPKLADDVRCPVCGGDCREVYLDDSGEAFGCDCCVKVESAEVGDPLCCPVCGGEADMWYYDADGNLCGCDCCVRVVDAEEFADGERAASEAEHVDWVIDWMREASF